MRAVRLGDEITIIDEEGDLVSTCVARSSKRKCFIAQCEGMKLVPEDEGLYWCRGVEGRDYDAFVVAHALGKKSGGDAELPEGWTSSTYSIRLGP